MKTKSLTIALFISTLLSSYSQEKEQETESIFTPKTHMKPLRAIENAPVKTRKEMDGEINDTELVLGVTIGGSSRAYPINMLNGPSREIINDKLGGKAIAATW